MNYKRLTILCGHYGSGKTNIAVNMAFDLKNKYEKVAVADLDIVNPYFRTKDSEKEFNERGIKLICSQFASSNVDLPSMPTELYSITDEKDTHFVLDIGGDDRGALALGRLSDMIKSENDYEMLMVINKFRPLTPDADSTIEVMREIEYACKIPFTGIVNNSNLGEETKAKDVINSFEYAKEVSQKSNLPIVLTTVKYDIYEELIGKTENLLPLHLQSKLI